MFIAQVDEKCSNQHWNLTLSMQFNCWNFLQQVRKQFAHTDMLEIQARFYLSHAQHKMYCKMLVMCSEGAFGHFFGYL